MTLAHPAIRAIEDYQKHRHPAVRLDALFYAFEIVLRVNALLLAAAFLASGETRDDRVRRQLLFRRYNLGDWLQLVETLVALDPAGTLPGLRDWYRHNSRGPSGSSLQRLVALRNRRAHDEDRTNPDTVRRLLDEAEPLMAALAGADASFGEFRCDGPARLSFTCADGTVGCGPFLLPGALAGRGEELLLYRGNLGTKLAYSTCSGVEYSSAELLDELAAALRYKVALAEIIDVTEAEHVLFDRLVECSHRTLARLDESKRYRRASSVARAGADTVYEAALQSPRPLLFIEGPEGAGKTTWACQLVERRLEAGAVVLFETGGRLTEGEPTSALHAVLRTRGELSTALNRLGSRSSDHRVVVVVDDLASGDAALLSIIRWAEQLEDLRSLRIVCTVRSSQLRVFLDGHTVSDATVRCYELPPFTVEELDQLAKRLPLPENAGAVTRDVRREVARRLGEVGDAAPRRPGLAATILEQAGSDLVPAGFSAAVTYELVFSRTVLRTGADGRPGAPLRGRLLRSLASALLRGGTDSLSVDGDEAAALMLTILETGARSGVYESLLADRILVEISEDLRSTVRFADPRLFEFSAALSLLPLEEPEQVGALLHSLCARSPRFHHALPIAAFVVIRLLVRAAPLGPVLQGMGDWLDPLMQQIAALDGRAYLVIFEAIVAAHRESAPRWIAALLRAGELRIAAHAAETLLGCVAGDEQVTEEARYLLIRAWYEQDAFGAAERELARMPDPLPPRLLAIAGDIAASRFDYARAGQHWRRLIDQIGASPGPVRGLALRGLAYVLIQKGESAEPQALLAEAIAILRATGEARILAEALGERGELFSYDGRFDEAEEALRESEEINQREGFLIGTGIVEGLGGQLAWLRGDFAEGERRLRRALDINRLVGNRWRIAWVHDRLGRLLAAQGRTVEAAHHQEEAFALFSSIGVAGTPAMPVSPRPPAGKS